MEERRVNSFWIANTVIYSPTFLSASSRARRSFSRFTWFRFYSRVTAWMAASTRDTTPATSSAVSRRRRSRPLM